MIKNKKGFTLIELIIVMAIIGILAVVAIVAISGKSMDARNARRMADMSAVQTGMALDCIEATTTTEDNVTCTGAAGALVNLSTCGSIGTLNFSTINDPSTSTTCAFAATGGTCDYGIVVGTVADTVESCDYRVYAALEDTASVDPAVNDIMEVTDNGTSYLAAIPAA